MLWMAMLILRLRRYSSVAAILAAFYGGWTLYSRYREDRRFEQRAREREVEAARKVVEAYGGERLTILSFAADTAEVKSGGRVVLCYGVNNATRVSIDPGVESLKPSLSRCIEVVPKRTTTYTLTASDDNGHTVTGALTVHVR